MQRTKIDWGIPNLYTWNPVTGCKRGCPYCYARRIHERFNKNPFSEIVYHPERLEEKMPKPPATVFVGSMSDIQYWTEQEKGFVFNVCGDNPQITFMFLSKSSCAYGDDLNKWNFPNNIMQGLTMVGMYDMIHAYEALNMKRFPRPFLSLEPLLGKVIARKDEFNWFERVIVGAMTGPGAVVPKPEWIQSIKDNVPADKLYWKPNIRKYL